MAAPRNLSSQAVLDGLGQAVLIFDSSNHLITENQAARTLLGSDLRMIRSEGWSAAAILFNTKVNDLDKTFDAIRARALASDRPVRFRAYVNGEHVPCWMGVVHGSHGEVYTMITVETPDWSALSELMRYYLNEVRESVETTRGHAVLIGSTLKSPKPKDTIETIGRRIGGFTKIIDTHMHRLGMLTQQMERFEAIRTNRIREDVRAQERKLRLADFIEDFVEAIQDDMLADPESDLHDHRRRIKTAVPPGLMVRVSSAHLSVILRDILRNAIMYSMKATPVDVIAHYSPKDHAVQIDVIDEGYGIRTTEAERVFAPFARARQPQIIGEFGYGLSLYLCKHEIEAMNGRIWFNSEEGVGTTFSMKIPAWRDEQEIETMDVMIVDPNSSSSSGF
jgi:signal transduction histidine kinase